MNDTRYDNIDFMRGIAIVAVVAGHAAILLTKKGILNKTFGDTVYTIIYSFHMPLFFAIAGYVSGIKREKTLWSQLKKDFIKLFIPYIFLIYIYYLERVMAAYAGVQLDNWVNISLKGAIEQLYKQGGESWFLLSLILVKILFDILIYYTNLPIVVSVFSLAFVCTYLGYGGAPVLYVGWGLFFVIGYMVWKYREQMLSRKMIFAAAGVIGIISGIILLYFGGQLTMLVKLLIGASVFVILCMITEGMKSVVLFNAFGQNSMIIYVFHGLMQFPVYYVLSKMIGNGYLLFVTLLLAQWMLIGALWWLIEHCVAFGWMKYIFRPTLLLNKKG